MNKSLDELMSELIEIAEDTEHCKAVVVMRLYDWFYRHKNEFDITVNDPEYDYGFDPELDPYLETHPKLLQILSETFTYIEYLGGINMLNTNIENNDPLRWFEFKFGVGFFNGEPEVYHTMFSIVDDLLPEEEKILDNDMYIEILANKVRDRLIHHLKNN